MRQDGRMTYDEAGAGPLHRAARIEARVSAVVAGRLRRRGWRPAVVPHVGYGGEGWVRLFARVLLVPPGSSRVGVEDARGWRRFVTPEAPGSPVTVRVGGRTHHATSDREGYLDLRVDSDLGPGWSQVSFEVEDAEPIEAPVHVVGPDTRLGLVSDIDDTVIETMLPRPLLAFRNAFLARENARLAVPGMADALRRDLRRASRTSSSSTCPPARGTSRSRSTRSWPGTATRTARCCSPTGARRPTGGSGQARTTSGPSCAGCSRSCPSCGGCWSVTTGSTTRACTPRPARPHRARCSASRSGSSA